VDFQGRVRMTEASMGESHIIESSRTDFPYGLISTFTSGRDPELGFLVAFRRRVAVQISSSVGTDVSHCLVNTTSFAHPNAACL
jgi:hypothetical protein